MKRCLPHYSRGASAPDRPGRGFALPVVLMVSLALASLIAVLLSRFTSQTRSVSAIVRSYENYHAGRGLHQLFETWLRTVNSSRISGKLGENGLALTVQLSEGLTANATSAETVKFYLADGQGSILLEPSTLPAEDMALAQAVINAARELDAGGSADEGQIAHRDFGPLAVSVRTASVRTLRAAVSGATGGEKVEEIVAELLRARDDAGVSATMVADVANKVGLSGDTRARFLKVLTVEPTLWNITADVLSDRLLGGGLIVRYRGMGLILPGGSSSGGTSARSIIRQWVREDFR